MATGDILTCTILATGWEAEIKIEGLSTGGTYAFGSIDTDVANAKVAFTVVSEGYTTAGSLSTKTRTVYGTTQRMKAYPNQATAEESISGSDVIVTVALSDYIYNDDKSGGAGTSGTNPTVTIASGFYTQGGTPNNSTTALAVTNNSTQDYPIVIGRWAVVPYQRFTSSFDLEAVVFHRFAENGKPVVCVKFADGVTTDTYSTAMVKSSKSDSLPCYRRTITASDYTDDSVVTCNFTAYPWVGDADSVLTSVGGSGGLALGPLSLLADSDDDYHKYVAVVDPVSGNNTTGVASTTYATAAASPFLNIRNAAAAITTAQSGDGGGGTIYLTEGSHASFGSGSVAATNVWITVTRDIGTTKANVALTATTSSYAGTPKLRLYDIAFKPTSTSYFGSSGTGYYLWMDQVDTTCVTQVTAQPMGEHEWAYYTFCTSDKLSDPWTDNGVNHLGALIRGCSATNCRRINVSDGYGPSCVLTTTVDHANAQAGRFVTISRVNSIVAYCQDLANPHTGSSLLSAQTISGDLAVVCNVIEKTGATTAGMSIYDDSNITASSNVLVWHNTVAGERSNIGYNAGTANTARSNFSVKFNSFQHLATKHDVFKTNGAYIGAWSVAYGVGWMGNNSEESPDEFAPYYGGIRSTRATAAGYTDDNSLTTSGTGNGDYNPAVGSVLRSNIPLAADVVIPYDIAGTAYAADGAAGAYTVAASSTVVPVFMAQYRQRWG